MGRENNPGLKILWLWTFGTAAVLVTNVVRTRMRDMEQIINAQDEAPAVAEAVSENNGYSDSVQVSSEEKS